VGPAESAGLNVLQVDERGVVTHHVSFDPDDIVAALDELDARFAALGGNALMATNRHSFDARDWETFASAFAETCTIADHRTAGWGLIDRAAFVDYQRSVVDLAEDAHLRVDHLRSLGNVSISTGRAFGTRAGGEWEIAFVTVGVAGPDGRATHLESYELGDMAVAVTRFHELVAIDNAEPFANAAWRVAEAQARAVNTQDWPALAATLAPHHQHDERRSGVGLVTRGDEAVAVYRYLFTLDRCRQERKPLATRGDRLALFRSRVTFEDGVAGPAEVVSLHVCEVDDRGLVTHAVTFDADDMTAALADLDARYLALNETGPRPNGAWECVERAMGAFEQHDWDAFAACHHPDMITDDRRRGIATLLVGDDAIATIRAMFDMASATWRCRLLATNGDQVALVEQNICGTDGAVGEIEVRALTVIETNADGRIVRGVTFDLDARDEADAEMRALEGRAGGASSRDPRSLPTSDVESRHPTPRSNF
jgi:hypothetical protein